MKISVGTDRQTTTSNLEIRSVAAKFFSRFLTFEEKGNSLTIWKNLKNGFTYDNFLV